MLDDFPAKPKVNYPMPIERKLAAIMFTDIAGYTALSAKDEKKDGRWTSYYKNTVEKHDNLISSGSNL